MFIRRTGLFCLLRQVKCNTSEERREVVGDLLVELPVEVLGDELQLVPKQARITYAVWQATLPAVL